MPPKSHDRPPNKPPSRGQGLPDPFPGLERQPDEPNPQLERAQSALVTSRLPQQPVLERPQPGLAERAKSALDQRPDGGQAERDEDQVGRAADHGIEAEPETAPGGLNIDAHVRDDLSISAIGQVRVPGIEPHGGNNMINDNLSAEHDNHGAELLDLSDMEVEPEPVLGPDDEEDVPEELVLDRKSTRLNSSHKDTSRMPSH